jgi:ABC-type branched-subunit amino acid transport system substrate-binding protein
MTSGPAGDYGRLSNIGIDAYLNSVNDAGGVLGRKIRCLHPDDHYDKNAAITNFDKAVQEGVFGFISLTGSAQVAAYLPRVVNMNIPAVGGFSGPDFSCDPAKPTYFQTRVSFLEETEKVVDKLWDEGFRNFGAVYQFDAYGHDFIEGAKKTLAKHGAKLVADVSYTAKSHAQLGQQDDYSDKVKQLQSASPPVEVVLMSPIYKVTARILRQSKEANFNPIFVMHKSSTAPGYHDIGTDADGMPFVETLPIFQKNEPPAAVNFRKAMTKYFPGEKPNGWSFKGYVDAMMFCEALKRTGKDLTRDKFVATLDKMKNVDLGLGKGNEISYTPQDHWGMHKIFWVTLKDGKVVPFDNWSGLRKAVKAK